MTKVYKKGDTIRKYIKFAYKGSGEPVNLSDCTVCSQMKKIPEKTLVASGTAVIDVTHGLITVTYTPTQTSALTVGSYGYDIRISSQNDILTIYKEEFVLEEAYTGVE